MDNIIIQYQGFHPSNFTSSYLDSILSELQQEAPFGASVRAVFKRKNKMFSASVRIMSGAGAYFATAQGVHMRGVIHKLTEQTRKQMKRWQSRRDQRLAKSSRISVDPVVTESETNDEPIS